MANFEPTTAKRFTVEHESVSFDENTGIGTVSITDYAQSSLGDVVFVELPALGTKVTQGGMYSVLRLTAKLTTIRANWSCGEC
jgi:glycine cleavage system H lipoate-binding protein